MVGCGDCVRWAAVRPPAFPLRRSHTGALHRGGMWPDSGSLFQPFSNFLPLQNSAQSPLSPCWPMLSVWPNGQGLLFHKQTENLGYSPALTVKSSATLGEQLNLTGPQFPHL